MPSRLATYGLDTNIFLELLLAIKNPTSAGWPVQRGLETQAAITSRPNPFIIVQQVFYETLNKLMERERLLSNLTDGYLIWQRFRDLPPADKDAAVASWAGAGGSAERLLLEGLRADQGLQIEVFPGVASPGEWFDSQQVFIAAHKRHGPRFELPDLVILSQSIVARVDHFVTRDEGLRQAIELLRNDAGFNGDIQAINGYKVPTGAKAVSPLRRRASPATTGTSASV
jgi:hypothetical protein